MKMEAQHAKTYGMKQKSIQRKFIPVENKYLKFKKPKLHLRTLGKKEQPKLKASRRKDIIRMRTEIPDEENKTRENQQNQKLALCEDQYN